MRAFVSQEDIAQKRVSTAPKTQGDPVVAEYIADLADSLARTARENGLPVLAHLLEMAREEAATAATGIQAPAQENGQD
jgi:cytosine/adenosine deaminase-related metal-dependent hydrolase